MNQHVIFEKQDLRFIPMDEPMRSKVVSQNFALICLPEVTLFNLLLVFVGWYLCPQNAAPVELNTCCRLRNMSIPDCRLYRLL
jgi:hypothetical protein